MRKALLVLVLIAASFGGGAFVNGPGLVWAKKYIASHWGGSLTALDSDDVVKPGEEPPKTEDDPFAAVALAPKPGGDSTTNSSTSEPVLITAADQNPPKVEAPQAPAGLLDSAPSSGTDESARPSRGDQMTPLPVNGSRKQANPDRRTAEPLVSPPSPPKEIAFPDAAPVLEPPKPDLRRGTNTGKTEKAGWEDAPDSAPAKPVLPRRSTSLLGESDGSKADPGTILPKDLATKPASLAAVGSSGSPHDNGTGAGSSASKEWNELRKRMKQMGVSRYWVEAEPGGSARFRCIIPLAGTRAVAQQFEAEGEDEFQAADAALRRVALWRATEP